MLHIEYLINRELFLQFWRLQVKDQGVYRSRFPKASPWLRNGCPAMFLHGLFFLCIHIPTVSSNKDIWQTGELTLWFLNYIFKHCVFKYSSFGLTLQYMNCNDTIQSIILFNQKINMYMYVYTHTYSRFSVMITESFWSKCCVCLYMVLKSSSLLIQFLLQTLNLLQTLKRLLLLELRPLGQH